MVGAGAAGLVSALFRLFLAADYIVHAIKPDTTSLFLMPLPISLLISPMFTLALQDRNAYRLFGFIDLIAQ
jgi:hypothetical protein